MGTIQGLTKARMLAIEAASVVAGSVVANRLILVKHDGSTIDAGSVIGPQGPQGIQGVQGTPGAIVVAARTDVVSPTRGMQIFESNTGLTLVYYGAVTGWRPNWGVAWGVLSFIGVTVAPAAATVARQVLATSPALTIPANRLIKTTGQALWTPDATAGYFEGYIQMDAADIGRWGQLYTGALTAQEQLHGSAVISPVAGVHTFRIQYDRNTGSGTLVSASGATAPYGYLLVEDIGPNGNAPAS